jgi:hypothetical protein
MRLENADWGAPKIHGELLKLGFAVSERTVARYLRGLRPKIARSDQRWKAFLANHREAIVVFDLSCCTHLDVQTAVLLPDHRAWSAEDSALQRDRSSDLRMDRAAVAESVSRSGSIPVRHLRPRFEVYNVDVVQLFAATGSKPKRTTIHNHDRIHDALNKVHRMGDQ